MNIPVNSERLARNFIELCEIESPSREEGRIAARLKEIFTTLGAESIYEDNSAAATGSESGNLIIHFPGRGSKANEKGFFLTSHMDTVRPCAGVKVVRKDDLFTSLGDTILGGDDKSGLAAIIELLEILRENELDHPPLELLITTCEELGLLGATALEYDKIRSPYGYALDANGINTVIVKAPAACKFEITVHGRAAHAGMAPEKGVSALMLAAKALAPLPTGRIGNNSTRNFGRIEGGVAFNIIPDEVKILGEVRSLDNNRVPIYLDEITDSFQSVINAWLPTEETVGFLPTFTFKQLGHYPALTLPVESEVLERLRTAGKMLDRTITEEIGGGGSDANILSDNGLPTAVISTGMAAVHTVEENITLKDMVAVTEILVALATVEQHCSPVT